MAVRRRLRQVALFKAADGQRTPKKAILERLQTFIALITMDRLVNGVPFFQTLPVS